jgi:hypothetical protein
MIKDEDFISSLASSKTRAMEKLVAAQVALMEMLKERLGKNGRKRKESFLSMEKDAIFLACEMYSRLGMMDADSASLTDDSDAQRE